MREHPSGRPKDPLRETDVLRIADFGLST